MESASPEDMCANETTNMFGGFEFANFSYPQKYDPLDFSTADLVKMVAYGIVFFVSLIGNLSVVAISAANSHMRSAINAYLVNLAAADICIVLFCMWVHLVNNLSEPMFVLGAFWCKFNGFAQMTSLTASVLTLTAIACDRFSAIMFPLRTLRMRGVHRSTAIIVLIWLVSAAVALPLLLYRDLMEVQWKDMVEVTCQDSWPVAHVWDPLLGRCTRTHKHKIAYYTMVTLALFFAPIGIMGVTYALIIWRLWVSAVPDIGGTSRVHSQHNAKKKVVKMVVMVVMVFVVCWAPLQVIILFGVLNKYDRLPEWFSHVEFFAYFLAYSNSLWNPVLYGGFNNAFRKGFSRLFRCRKPTVVLNGFQLQPYGRMTATRGTLTSSLSRPNATSKTYI
ncbi:QRFP-like peptide receptor isoform X2 [Amphibalanus amphitrite]|uniref:QRFP-like peptide receptor isoform X2 n=1 Tax=Amphibalanus amphitrite TaxID=1232801 RepID=UPI001C91BBC0|nr:QRFP-like peptide receptor isoform X2 [Amphibalanus amphitrite]